MNCENLCSVFESVKLVLVPRRDDGLIEGPGDVETRFTEMFEIETCSKHRSLGGSPSKGSNLLEFERPLPYYMQKNRLKCLNEPELLT